MNCVIMHGCSDGPEDNPAGHWMPWLKTELDVRGIPTEIPEASESWRPAYANFKTVFDRCRVDADTVLVGHSCGCAFLVRWLEETRTRVRKLVLVAPWKISDPGDAIRDAFYGTPISPSVKELAGETVIFTSDNEEPDGKESARIFAEALDARIVELSSRGHYTLGDRGTQAFPELREEVLK